VPTAFIIHFFLIRQIRLPAQDSILSVRSLFSLHAVSRWFFSPFLMTLATLPRTSRAQFFVRTLILLLGTPRTPGLCLFFPFELLWCLLPSGLRFHWYFFSFTLMPSHARCATKSLPPPFCLFQPQKIGFFFFFKPVSNVLATILFFQLHDRYRPPFLPTTDPTALISFLLSPPIPSF